MEELLLRVTAFTDTPGPRYRDEGLFSGQEFRESYLEPQFKKAREVGHHLVVNLDGTEGYATSFLEEAFGGLARIYEPDDVAKTLTIICLDEPYIIEEVKRYIKDARNK